MRYVHTLLIAMALAGAALAAPEPVVQQVAASEGAPIQVEVEGVAYMGDTDRLADVRARARQEAVRQAGEAAGQVYLESYSRAEMGELTEDVVQQAVAGVITRMETLDEGLDGTAYKVRLRARVEPADVEQVLAAHRVVAKRSGIRPDLPDDLPSASALPGQRAQVCFYGLTEVLIARVYSTLIEAPGASRVERRASDEQLCYTLAFAGDLVDLETWIRAELRSDERVDPFQIEAQEGGRRLGVYFDAGFD
jgi:hypothetical protein